MQEKTPAGEGGGVEKADLLTKQHQAGILKEVEKVEQVEKVEEVQQVKEEIDRDVRPGVLEPVCLGESTVWCSRMVVCRLP